MSTRRRRKKSMRKSPLTHAVILAWADDHRERTGEWPIIRGGEVLADPNEKWFNIDQCLRLGLRGLPGGDSLTQLLVRERGHRNLTNPPDLTEDQIAAWAVAHRQRTGDWPTQHSGPVEGQRDEVWANIDGALIFGRRGLPGGESLAKLLHQRFGARNWDACPPLTEEQILEWADEHRQRTGRWPIITSGPVARSPDDTWTAIDDALRRGARGLSGGSSIAKLLALHRGVRNQKGLAPLTEADVLDWADDHHARTGQWPAKGSGPVLAAPGEVWNGIDIALVRGRRGLPGGDSLSTLLARHGRKPRYAQPKRSRASRGTDLEGSSGGG